jgi:hypothetical protein
LCLFLGGNSEIESSAYVTDLGSILGNLFITSYELLSAYSNNNIVRKTLKRNGKMLSKNNGNSIENDQSNQENKNENSKFVIMSDENNAFEDGFCMLSEIISHLLEWSEKQSLIKNDNLPLSFKSRIFETVVESVENIYELFEKTEKEEAEDFGYSYNEKKKLIGDRGIFYFSDGGGRVLLIKMIRKTMLSACDYSDTFHRFGNDIDDNTNNNNYNDVDDNDDVKGSENNNVDTDCNNHDNNNNNIDLSNKRQIVSKNISVILKTVLFLLKNEYNKMITKNINGPENVPGIIQVTQVLPQNIPDSSEFPLKNIPKKIKSVRTFRVVIVADEDDAEEHSAPFMDDADDDFIPKKKPRISKK